MRSTAAAATGWAEAARGGGGHAQPVPHAGGAGGVQLHRDASAGHDGDGNTKGDVHTIRWRNQGHKKHRAPQ